MVTSLGLIRSRGDLIVLVIFLSIGAMVTADALGAGGVAGLIAVIGFAVVLPLVVHFGDRLIDGDSKSNAASDPLEELRDRYARGEISHEEFERRTERLVETEDLDRRTTGSVERDPARERQLE